MKVSNGSYVINGNWMIGPSKDSEAAGTVFTYYHPSPTEILESMVEYIIAPGPINTSIDIMVIISIYWTASLVNCRSYGSRLG